MLREQWQTINIQVDELEAELRSVVERDDACARLASIPGIGAITASAIVAAIGDGRIFRSGRDFAAWLGLVPKQHSTGGRSTLLGISKRGNAYLRTLLIHGSRCMMRFFNDPGTAIARWALALKERVHANCAGKQASSDSLGFADARHILFGQTRRLRRHWLQDVCGRKERMMDQRSTGVA